MPLTFIKNAIQCLAKIIKIQSLERIGYKSAPLVSFRFEIKRRDFSLACLYMADSGVLCAGGLTCGRWGCRQLKGGWNSKPGTKPWSDTLGLDSRPPLAAVPLGPCKVRETEPKSERWKERGESRIVVKEKRDTETKDGIINKIKEVSIWFFPNFV